MPEDNDIEMLADEVGRALRKQVVELADAFRFLIQAILVRLLRKGMFSEDEVRTLVSTVLRITELRHGPQSNARAIIAILQADLDSIIRGELPD